MVLLRPAGALLCGMLTAGCGAEREAAGGSLASPRIGAPAPAYSALSIDGDTVSLAGERGRVVLLNVWATWCRPCREELPVLQALHEAHAPEGLEIIGVSVDAAGDERKIREFLREFGITYRIWRDPGERVASTFFTIGVPATYLIGRDGMLLWRHLGPIRADDPRLMPLLRRALAERTAG